MRDRRSLRENLFLYEGSDDARQSAIPTRPMVKTAVALQYEASSMRAPQVVATGKGVVAEKIVALARQAGVPVREDAPLAAALSSVDLNAYVPPELYAVVAKLLAFVYRLDGDFAKIDSQADMRA